MHTLIFADGALGAKNARDCSQKQYFDAGMERKNGDRNGQKNEKSKLDHKKCSYWGRLGVKKVNFLIKITWSRFAKTYPPLEQEQHFWKNVMQKVSWNMKSIKEAVWSLHFWCIFVTIPVEDKFFASCSALAIVFAKSQNQLPASFWVAGRNAQVRWGEIWGGFVICRLRLAFWFLRFGSDTPCHAYGKGGGFNWRPSGEGTPPPFNLCSAYSFRSAKGRMQSEAGDCMRTKSWRLALQGIVPKWYWFAYMLGYRNMCCMSFRFWSTECGEHFCTKWGQMRCKKMEISLRSHAIKQTMLNIASEKGL